MTDKLRVLDLFSGIGGFSLGLERTGGFETGAFCEIDPFCQKVLRKHWPDVPIHDDVTKLRAEDVGTVDVITGGFPCQPYSYAGKRKGTEDARDLWPAKFEIIKALRPTWVVGENVTGLISMAFPVSKLEMESRIGGRTPEGVDYLSVFVRSERMLLADICDSYNSIGYAVQPFVIPACAVDAKHRRERVWIIAYSGSEQYESGCDAKQRQTGEKLFDPDTASERRGETRQHSERQAEWPARFREILADACGARLQGCPPAGNDGENRSKSRDEQPPRRSLRKRPKWEPESSVGRVANGVPRRVDRLRGLGNAVVPQIPELIGHAILEAAE